MLAKTPLDYRIEAVERKYGSVNNAPNSALKHVHAFVNKHVQGKYEYRSSHVVRHHYKHYIKVSLIHGRYYTNSHIVCKVVHYIKHGYNKNQALRLCGFSGTIFHRYHIPYTVYYTYTNPKHNFSCSCINKITLNDFLHALHRKYSFLPYVDYADFCSCHKQEVTKHIEIATVYYRKDL